MGFVGSNEIISEEEWLCQMCSDVSMCWYMYIGGVFILHMSKQTYSAAVMLYELWSGAVRIGKKHGLLAIVMNVRSTV